MIEYLRPQASSFAGDIDGLFMLVVYVVGFWFVATNIMFFWLIFRFRARPGVPAAYVTGKEPDLKKWITVPHALIILCDVVLVAGAINVWYKVKQDLPEEAIPYGVIGQQWAWTFVHPGPDKVLDTADDIRTIDEMHVQLGQKYIFRLESKDVLHSFSVPAFRLRQDAVPGRRILGWFQPTQLPPVNEAGEKVFDFQCAEMCGIGHGIMRAKVFVETEEEHQAWVAAQVASQVAAK